MLSSCSTFPRSPFTEPLDIGKTADTGSDPLIVSGATGRTTLHSEPGLSTPQGRSATTSITSAQPPSLTGEPISINFEGVALPAFVNTMFGDLLDVTFEIENAVMERQQLVTLRTADALERDDFYRLVTQVLGNYGIGVAYENNVYRVIENAQVQSEIPRIIRSRASAPSPVICGLYSFMPR